MRQSPFTAVYDAPGDRYVLAVAIRCRASVIVTFNEKDFPQTALAVPVSAQRRACANRNRHS